MARILVVDDDAHLRGSLEAILHAEGHDVRCAAGGREALVCVEEALPDLIVLDLAMPGMDGWHVLEELHVRGLRSQTRVLLISGHFTPDAVAGRAPSDLFLAKPFERDHLVQLVSSLLAEDPDDLYERRERARDLARLIERVDQKLR